MKGFLAELLPWLLIVFFGTAVGFWVLTVQGCHHGPPGVHACSAVPTDGGFLVSCENG